MPPSEALDLIRAEAGIPIFAKEDENRPPSGVTYLTVGEDSFTIHSPAPDLSPDGRVPRFGSSITGKLVPIDGGSRLEITTDRWAATRSQRERLIATVVVVAMCVAGMVAQAGNALALTLMAVLFVLAPLAIWLFRRSAQSRRLADIYDNRV